MSKSKKSPSKRRTDGLPENTERVTFRWLEGPDDPHFALHTMTCSMREVPEQKRASGGWAKPDDPIYKRGWTIAPFKSARRRKQ